MGIENNNHAWVGDVFVDSYIVLFQERLNEVSQLLATYKDYTHSKF